MLFQLEQQINTFPLRGAFRIARGAKTQADVVTVTLKHGPTAQRGRGECVPYARYGESMDTVAAQILFFADELTTRVNISGDTPNADKLDDHYLRDIALLHDHLHAVLPAGAARNAIDCALWDLYAKLSAQPIWACLGMEKPTPALSAYTVSYDSAAAMAKKAAALAPDYPLLKLKLASRGDIDRLHAVRRAAPQNRIMVDANEGWTLDDYHSLLPTLLEIGIEAIEQPLPSHLDQGLIGVARPIPLIADESCHTRASLPALKGRYDMVNIKLDKSGGLTEALALKKAAKSQGFDIMIGCMVSSSLAVAPATLLCAGAKIIDLDAPLLIAQDRKAALPFTAAHIHPPTRHLWG